MPKRRSHKMPAPGQTLVRTFKGKQFKLLVVDEGGKLAYRCCGKTYASPSGAAKAITGREVNGWVFWGMA